MPLTAKVAVWDATIYYDKLYTYVVPAPMEGHIFVGSMVLVPFGRGRARPRIGVVLAVEMQNKIDARVKEIFDVAPGEAVLTQELLSIVKYLKQATFCTWYEAVKAVLPYGAQYRAVQDVGSGAWGLKPLLSRHTEAVYTLVMPQPQNEARKLTDKQQAVLACLAKGPRTRSDLMQACGVGRAVADGLVKRGCVTLGEQDKNAVLPDDVFGEGQDGERNLAKGGEKAPLLSVAQQQVTDVMLRRMEESKTRPVLLYGVTGSGKTPVFLALVQAALDKGKTALVLVPEIGLTPQMLAHLRGRFGRQVAVQHSAMSNTARLLQWRSIQRGEARVVVGTRSAVFAPLENIGVIVVDEEQERTYQSESAPRYDAIEVARRRATHHDALLLLASATPAVTDYFWAQKDRYELLSLHERYGGLSLPAVELVDMRQELLEGNTGIISKRLAQGIAETIEADGQVILLLNRRGYHRVGVCRTCGEALRCGECSVPMVFHKAKRGEKKGELGGEGTEGAGAAARFSQSENPGVAGECSVPMVFHKAKRGEKKGELGGEGTEGAGAAARFSQSENPGVAGECSVPMVFHKAKRGEKKGELGGEGTEGAGAAARFSRSETPGNSAAEESDRAPVAPEAGRLLCHYCGKTHDPAPALCPACGGEIRYAGFGTQRMEAELAECFPGARVLRMDLDSTTKRGAHAGMLRAFGRGEYDILLGTQMVAKGLDFERVRLVGVVGIDSLLFSQGYRAYENVFSLVTQVVGRSGRAGQQGRAMIQTVDTNSPVLNLAAAQDYNAFYHQEIAFRKMLLYPPFCSICVAGFASKQESDALRAGVHFAKVLTQKAKEHPKLPLRVLGPAPMGVAMLAGVFRFRLTIKCRVDEEFRALLAEVLQQYNKDGWPRKAGVSLDFHSDAGG